MSLIVETGAGSPDSESYVSVADATTYHASRGNAAWAALATDALREQALRKATDYIAQQYRGKWKGYRSNTTQALDWPRRAVPIEDSAIVNYIPFNSIPEEVKNACCELALRASAADLSPDLERATASESVGSLSVTYVQGAPQNTVYRAIDQLLRPLLINGGTGMQIVRA